MSALEENQTIATRLAGIQSLLGSPTFSDEKIFVDLQNRLSRDKISDYVGFVLNALKSANSQDVSVIGLAQLAGQLETVQSELVNFSSNQNPAHIHNARNHIDQVGYQLLWALGLAPFRGAAVAGLKGEVQDYRVRADALAQSLITRKAELEASVSSMIEQIKSLEALVGTLKDAVEKQRAEALTVTAEVQGKYEITERELRKTFEETQNRLNEQNDGAANARLQKIDELQKTIDSDSNALIRVLNEKKDEASKIVQIVGNIGVTGNYQKVADTEAGAANVWRIITVLIFCLSIIVVLVVLGFWIFDPAHSSADLAGVFVRLLSAFVLAAPAYYTAKESARHRTNADQARRAELELASLGPFIELMPEEKKVAIKEELSKRYFGQQVDAHTVENLVSPKDVLNVLSKLISKQPRK